MSETEVQQAVIEMKDVHVGTLRDPTLAVLENVNWSVSRGEFWVVAGAQESGKTDLLLHAAGLVAPAVGECRVFGFNTCEFDETQIAERLRVGLVFTDGKLFNYLTIAGNVGLPLRYHKNEPEAETAKTVEALLQLMELAPYASLMPGNVAASWRKRAALARALALKPELLLLDTPNGGLTARHRHWLVNFLDQLWHGHQFFGGKPMTIVATTDDLYMWQHPQRKFAAVHEGKFSVLGPWGCDQFANHGAVKELMAGTTEKEGVSNH